jgi:hypothetical protein
MFSPKKDAVSPAQQDRKSHKVNPFFTAVMVLLLAVLVVAFVYTPTAKFNSDKTSGKIVFGSYAGHDIAYQQHNSFASMLSRMSENASASGYDPENPYINYQIWSQVYRMMSEQAVLLYDADRMGFNVSDQALSDVIRGIGIFNKDGAYSEEAYNEADPLMREGIVQQVRESLLLSSYVDAATADWHFGQKALAQYFNFSDVRRFDMASFALSDYPVAELVKFATDNSQMFQRRQFKRVLLKGKQADVNKTYAQLAKGDLSFDDLVARSQEELSQEQFSVINGDMGQQLAYQIAKQLRNADDLQQVFQLADGAVSVPLRYNSVDAKDEVYILYQAQGTVANWSADAENSTKDVLSYLLAERKSMLTDFFIEKAKELQDASFNEKVATLGGTVGRTDYFGLAYQILPDTVDPRQPGDYPFARQYQQFMQAMAAAGQGKIANALMNSREFFQQAFALTANQVSQPIVLDDVVVVIKMVDEKPAESQDAVLYDTFAEYAGRDALMMSLKSALDSKQYKDNFAAMYTQKIMPSVMQSSQPQEPVAGPNSPESGTE